MLEVDGRRAVPGGMPLVMHDVSGTARKIHNYSPPSGQIPSWRLVKILPAGENHASHGNHHAPGGQKLTGKLSVIIALLGISVFINYVDRGNLSIAAPMLKEELGISASQLGVLLSAFFWTYACLQPVSGWLVIA